MSETKQTTLRDVLTDQEREFIVDFPHQPISIDKPLRHLRWEQIETLGLLFIRTIHGSIAPGGPLVVIGAQEIMRRMVANDIPFDYVTFPEKG